MREKIFMICFIFYLNYLNDKEKWLKLSIYIYIYIYIYIFFFKFGNLDTHMF